MQLRDILGSLEVKLYAMDRLRCGRWWNYPAVNSPFVRLLYIIDGKAEVRHGGRVYQLRPGRLVLTPPFTPVDYLCRSSFENYYAIFTCRTLDSVDIFALGEMDYALDGDALTPQLFVKLLELNPRRGLKSPDPYRPDYDSSIWAADPATMPVESLLGTEGILKLLLSRFLATFRFCERGQDGTAAGRFIPALRFIERNLSHPISLASLAETAHLNPTYFSDCFLKAMGMRPVEWLTRKRVERAQLLLLTSGMGIKGIAAECGFRDVTYFHKVFKRQTGLTPAEYRAPQ
jgi:AraC-like DNA-binding protein